MGTPTENETAMPRTFADLRDRGRAQGGGLGLFEG
jgi:hypothetical protein